MPNVKELSDLFQASPPDFLAQYPLSNPGGTNFNVAAPDQPQRFLNEFLEYGGTKENFAFAAPSSYQARTKVMKGSLDYLSLAGGLVNSGRLNGFVPDTHDQEGMPIQICGRPIVKLDVDIHSVDGFDVYFLPWKANNTVTMTLGQDARYFITAAMTGCTFQVTGPMDAPIVSHANAGGEVPANKLAFMDGQLKTGIRNKLDALLQGRVTRLQTGLWGTVNSGNVKEVSYSLDPGGERATAFQDTKQGLSRDEAQRKLLKGDNPKYRPGDIEVEQTIDGDFTQIVVAVVGWRPPTSRNWEFYYQVWADYTLERRVYRHEKKFFGGTKRKAIEKIKLNDQIILVPGRKLWPNGVGWPDAYTSSVVQASGKRRLSLDDSGLGGKTRRDRKGSFSL
jgi:hypothetical protein